MIDADSISGLAKSKIVLFLALFLTVGPLKAQQIPKPADVFGFRPGADYKLANYGQMLEYYDQLVAASDRVKKVEIGQTVEGRPMILLFISDADNIQQLDKWQDTSVKLARARIDSVEAQQLAEEGKAIVWIDGGMHSSEMAHGQMTPELAYRVATEESPEMQHIRENVVFLLMPIANPDGVDIVSSWYKKYLGTPYETTGTPWLYQRYIGHDNNRDGFMGNMPETKNLLKILSRQWIPQIVYNQHQTSPSWARIFVPPFNDPVNRNIHPGLTTSINEIGMAMQNRFAIKRMPGAVSRLFSMFYTGSPRNAAMRHNQIGILTETAHSTPTPRYYDPSEKPETIGGYLGDLGFRTDSTSLFYPYPWEGGESHFRDAVDYMITGSLAVLNYAADRRYKLLHNIYRMGRDAITEGEAGNPYAYIIPKQQWDQWEAQHLVNILFRGGLEVEQSTEDFTAGDNHYEAGSYILHASQSFRPYLMDLLDKQHYPTIYKYPGGPPKIPYDLTGWTLPYMMGVTVDRIDGKFSAATNKVTDFVAANETTIDGNAEYGYVISPTSNISIKAVNTLLRQGAKVSRALEGFGEIAAGSFIVTGTDISEIKDLGLSLKGLPAKPDIDTSPLAHPKVGIYKSWIANMDEGWTRWLLEEYNVEVDTLHNADIREGNLSDYHSIIIPDQRPEGIMNGYSVQEMPEKYTGGIGIDGTQALKGYVENGGTLITFDKASKFIIQQFGLPLENAVEGISEEDFVIPGSPVRSVVDTSSPLGWGMQDTTAALYLRSFAFRVKEQRKRGEGGIEDIADAPKATVDEVVNYADSNLVMSGFGIGAEEHIAGKPAMVRIPEGKGQMVLFAFRPQFRGETPGTYKLIFNAIMGSAMEAPPK